MTPQEQSDYKRNWLPGHMVRLHSDLHIQGKDWCKRHVERHRWSFSSYTDVYEHTFHFEKPADAREFEEQFPRYANQ